MRHASGGCTCPGEVRAQKIFAVWLNADGHVAHNGASARFDDMNNEADLSFTFMDAVTSLPLALPFVGIAVRIT